MRNLQIFTFHRLLSISLFFLCFVTSSWFHQSLACTSEPPAPPPFIIEPIPHPDGPKVLITVSNYSTFGANPGNETCACGLNIPLNIGTISEAHIYHAGTTNPVSGWDFSPNTNTSFDESDTWQGFSSVVNEEIPAGLAIDLVFLICLDPVFAGNNQGQALNDLEQFLENMEPLVGTGGADENGVPDHHISVLGAGDVEQKSEKEKKKEYEACMAQCEQDPSPLRKFMCKNHCKSNYEAAKEKCPKKHTKVGYFNGQADFGAIPYLGGQIDLLGGLFQNDVLLNGSEGFIQPPVFFAAPYDDFLNTGSLDNLPYQPIGQGQIQPDGLALLPFQPEDLFPGLNSIIICMRYYDPFFGWMYTYSTIDLLPYTPYIFKELWNEPLGDVQLQTNNDGHLVVSNIGSSGQDGVSIDLGDVQRFEFDFIPLPIQDFQGGGGFGLEAFGSIGGPDFMFNQQSFIENNNKFQIITHFFDELGTDLPSKHIQLFMQGELVAEIPNSVSPDLGFTPQMPIAIDYFNHNGEGSGFIHQYENPVPMTIPGLGTIEADEMIVTSLFQQNLVEIDLLNLNLFNPNPDPLTLIIPCEEALRLLPPEGLLLDPMLPIPPDFYPAFPLFPGEPFFPPLPLPSGMMGIAPPDMLDPLNEFQYGLDYAVWENQFFDMIIDFYRPGPYFVRHQLQDGSFFDINYHVGTREADELENCGKGGKYIEIPCGNADVAVISSTLNLRDSNGNPYDPDWSNAGTSAEANTIAAAKQIICDAYENNNNQPVSVAIDAHGSSGSITIGTQTITIANVCDFADDLNGKVSEITLFSCSVGDGNGGLAFIRELEQKIGANVRAYTGTVKDVPPSVGDQAWWTAGEERSWEAALAVDLVNFEIQNQDNQSVLLEWWTANEVDLAYFEIERSDNLKDWISLGKEVAKSNSNVGQPYTFTDKKPIKGLNYYRLKIVENNGLVYWSNIKTVVLKSGSPDAISLYPNPVVAEVTLVQDQMEGVAQIQVFDSKGIMVWQTKQEGTHLDLGDLAAGFYVLKMVTKNQTSSTTFIKR